MNSLRIGEKTAKVPVIQGGMGVGVSLGNLAGAVAKEGGVGIISTAQIGYREPDFDKQPEEANHRAIKAEMEKARAISPDGIIGYNIMVALKDYKEHVAQAVAAGADIIISGAGLPTELPGLVAQSGTKIAPIVSTEKSAKVILKYWGRKYKRTADLVVIEGPRAGGHLGFQLEELNHYTPEAYEEEIQKIIQIVREYEEQFDTKIPVVIAGGISDAKDVKRALDLGADGVQVASCFVTTEECDAHINYKQAYIHASKEDITIVKSPVGMPGRAILNPFMKRVMKGEKIAHTPCHRCLAKCNPAEIPYCITDSLVNAARGNVDDALLFCGANAYQADHIGTVKEVMTSLLEEI